MRSVNLRAGQWEGLEGGCTLYCLDESFNDSSAGRVLIRQQEECRWRLRDHLLYRVFLAGNLNLLFFSGFPNASY